MFLTAILKMPHPSQLCLDRDFGEECRCAMRSSNCGLSSSGSWLPSCGSRSARPGQRVLAIDMDTVIAGAILANVGKPMRFPPETPAEEITNQIEHVTWGCEMGWVKPHTNPIYLTGGIQSFWSPMVNRKSWTRRFCVSAT